MERKSSSPFIETVWSCEALAPTTRTVLADACISIALVEYDTKAYVSLIGPKTKPSHVSLPSGHKTTTIRLKPGVCIKNFPAQSLIDDTLDIPADVSSHFLFDGNDLSFPDFHSAERLIEELTRLGYLDYRTPGGTISPKSHSRHIKRTTGLSPYQLYQLQRIHQALRLLKRGVPAVEVASELDFVDQPHLIRASRQFLGYTPKHLMNLLQNP